MNEICARIGGQGRVRARANIYAVSKRKLPTTRGWMYRLYRSKFKGKSQDDPSIPSARYIPLVMNEYCELGAEFRG